MGMPVSKSCTESFARSTCQGFTGRDCMSHRDFPSSETEGTTGSVDSAKKHSIAHSSTGTLPGRSPNTSFMTVRNAPPFHSSATPQTGSIRMPKPQLSI